MKPVSSYRSRALQGETSEGPKSKHQVKAEKQARRTLNNRARTEAKKAAGQDELEPTSPTGSYFTAANTLSRGTSFDTVPSLEPLSPASTSGTPSVDLPSRSSTETSSSLEEFIRSPFGTNAPRLRPINTSRQSKADAHDAPPTPSRTQQDGPRSAIDPVECEDASPMVARQASTNGTIHTVEYEDASPVAPRRSWAASIKGLFASAGTGLANAARWARDTALSLWDSASAKAAAANDAVRRYFGRDHAEV